MRVIICGAGQVGFNIARYLCADAADITVIDQRPDLVRKISDMLDVKAIVGHASHPAVLEEAGAADAEMIIAVTHADEVNMVACQVAHSLFDVGIKIARVRAQGYLAPLWSDLYKPEHLPIDVIISPEIEVARAATRRLRVPGAMDMIPLVDDRVRMIGVHCGPTCPVINTPLRQLTALFPDLNLVVIGIKRQDRYIVPVATDQIMEGDDVYFVVATDRTDRALAAFGHEEREARRILIFGGGNIGLFLAQGLEHEGHDVSVKVIEIDPERAEYIARALHRTTVLCGDALDSEILQEAGVHRTETVVAVTNDDETNVLSALLAKRFGVRRAITLINKNDYTTLVSTLGVDTVINPRAITVSTILQHVRRGRIHGVHSFADGVGELIEAEALETSGLVGKPLRDLRLPNGVLLGAIVRGDQVITPRGSTVIENNDRVVLFAAADVVKKVEKMFSVGLEFFG